ncbi:hypothetical protein [Micromonospora sp. NPDC005652]|uniref:hypothetical protein n=1 Tax=Micromonospora sp. NPDC005652 TaxID=3157046 RepID=UPI0033E2A329
MDRANPPSVTIKDVDAGKSEVRVDGIVVFDFTCMEGGLVGIDVAAAAVREVARALGAATPLDR